MKIQVNRNALEPCLYAGWFSGMHFWNVCRITLKDVQKKQSLWDQICDHIQRQGILHVDFKKNLAMSCLSNSIYVKNMRKKQSMKDLRLDTTRDCIIVLDFANKKAVCLTSPKL